MEAEVRYSLLLLGTLLTTSGGNSTFACYCEGDCAIRGTWYPNPFASRSKPRSHLYRDLR